MICIHVDITALIVIMSFENQVCDLILAELPVRNSGARHMTLAWLSCPQIYFSLKCSFLISLLICIASGTLKPFFEIFFCGAGRILCFRNTLWKEKGNDLCFKCFRVYRWHISPTFHLAKDYKSNRWIYMIYMYLNVS